MRTGRRRSHIKSALIVTASWWWSSPVSPWAVLTCSATGLARAAGASWWRRRVPGHIGAEHDQVGLEIRNAATPVTIVAAKIVPRPSDSTAITVVPTGEEDKGFTLDVTSPRLARSTRHRCRHRNGIIAGRFTVDCGGLLAPRPPRRADPRHHPGRYGARVEELTPPVVGDVPWLTATATGCATTRYRRTRQPTTPRYGARLQVAARASRPGHSTETTSSRGAEDGPMKPGTTARACRTRAQRQVPTPARSSAGR